MDDNPETSHLARLDTEEISILLIGNEEEQNEAIRLIHKYVRRLIISLIRRAALSLGSDEVSDVYQEVILAVLRAAREQRYDPDQPLLPFIFTLARRRAIDRIREKSRKIENEQLLDAVAETLVDTKVGEAWRIVASKHDGRRMLEIIRSTITKMPERQRQVASVIIDHFPETPSLQEIQENIHRRTDEHLTILAVKSARREARKKIRDQLIREGYMERDHDADIE